MRFKLPRSTGAIALVCGLAILGSPDSHAAGRTEVNPSLVFGAGYSDNINYSGVVSSSDSSATLGFYLPIRRRFPKGATFLVLNGTYVKQTDSSALDRFNYGGGFGVVGSPAKRTSLSFTANYLHTQAQGDAQLFDDTPETTDDSEVFLTQRSQRDVGALRFGISQQISRTWSWSGDLNASTKNSETIQDFNDNTTIPDFETFEDKTQYGGAVTVSKQISARTSLGGTVRHTQFDLDLSGKQETNSAQINVEHKIDSVSTLNVSAGGYESTGQAADGTGVDDQSDGVQYNAFYTRTMRSTAMNIGLTRVPGSGGNLRGTATQTTATFSLAGRESLFWHWSALLKFALREPNNQIDPDRQGTAFKIKLERLFKQQLGFNTTLTLSRQSIDGNAQPDFDAFVATVGLVWYPRGRQAAGGDS